MADLMLRHLLKILGRAHKFRWEALIQIFGSISLKTIFVSSDNFFQDL
jgi:hypothetical protein